MEVGEASFCSLKADREIGADSGIEWGSHNSDSCFQITILDAA